MKKLQYLVFFAFIFTTTLTHAKTLVLVQGYLGNAGSWRATGITRMLQHNGWVDAGHLAQTGFGISQQSWRIKNKQRFYSIDLPTEASIPVQASYLAAYLQMIKIAHAKDEIILVGHSAGGVVARTAMVAYPTLKVDELITIASPHHGTQLAEDGLSLSNSPVGFFAPFMGAGTINRSRALYSDLIRERPGSFLNWLNTRPHPDARYVAVMRSPRPGFIGDKLVPGWSQDLRGVTALKGHEVSAWIAPGGHALTINDGAIILQMLSAGI